MKSIKCKIKVVAIRSNRKEPGGNASRFRNSGEYLGKFRTPYTKSEEEAVVDFFLQNGGFSLRK